MSFVELAKTAPTSVVCVVGSILCGLPDDEAEALSGMLAAPVDIWPHTGEGSIQAAFKAEGYAVSDKPIRAHRANACRCHRADS